MQTNKLVDNHHYVESTMKRFKLVDMREQYIEIIEQASKESMSYLEFLVCLLSVEEDGKNARRKELLLDKASFDTMACLKDIDYSFNPSLDQQRIEELGKLHFLEEKENIIISGFVSQLDNKLSCSCTLNQKELY